MSDCTCVRGDDGQVRVPRSRCPQHGWAGTPTPAPALTDEQIEEWHDWYAKGWDRKKFDAWLAAVIARAKWDERERIAARLESWAEGHKKSGNTEHFAALHFASFMVHHDETNWPSTGPAR